MLTFLLLLLAFICFVAATFGAAVPRINLVALGLAFWVLVSLIGAWP
jgi:hypothetical protein